jgi:hypothetical protein
MTTNSFAFQGRTRVNRIDNHHSCGVRRNDAGEWVRTEAQTKNVAKLMKLISELRQLARYDVLDEPEEIQDSHFDMLITCLDYLLGNTLDGLNKLQRASYYAVEEEFINHFKHLVLLQGNLESDSVEYYHIIDGIATCCTVLRAGILYWMDGHWDN